jgi:hypothetical protein
MVIFGFKSGGWECPPAHVKTTIANGYSSFDALIGIDARRLPHLPADGAATCPWRMIILHSYDRNTAGLLSVEGSPDSDRNFGEKSAVPVEKR